MIALLVLVVATRQGQLEQIASYAAGAAVAAISSVLVGGGTTLAYTTGDELQRSAVRLVRTRIVVPIVATAILIATLVYATLGTLAPTSIAAGGFAVLAGVGAELDASYLRRHIQTGALLTSDMLNRLIALTLVLCTANFAIAMMLGAAVRAILLRFHSRFDETRSTPLQFNLTSLRTAYELKKTSMSILYSLNDRIGVLLVPLFAPISVAGGYAATTNAQQSASGTLMTGLQTTLAARSHRRQELAWANKIDFAMIACAMAFASVAIFAKHTIWTALSLNPSTMPDQYWIPSMLLVPAAIASRVFEFRLLARKLTAPALVARSSATALVVICAIWSVSMHSVPTLVWGMLVAECFSTSVALGYLACSPNEEGED